MHGVEEIRAEYDRLDRLLGVDTSGVELVLSDRSVKRLGSCRYPSPDGTKPMRITISSAILSDDAQFWDTVRHEYAHAAVYLLHPGERHAHDAVWREVCRRIGCTPKSTAPPVGEAERLRRERARYLVKCAACGAETYYLRAGKIVRLMERGGRRRVRCGCCGSNDLALYERN